MIRFVILIELGRPHLVLANVGRDDRLAFGLDVKFVDDLLHSQTALFLERQRMFGFITVHLGQPLL